MAKKCVICSREAEFVVKGTSDFYCPPCAEENFGDVSLLLAIEDQAKELKKAMENTGETVQIDEIPPEKIVPENLADPEDISDSNDLSYQEESEQQEEYADKEEYEDKKE